MSNLVLTDGPLWNKVFTGMLRQENRMAWGNWMLDPSVAAGAVGIVDPKTGAFTKIGMLPDAAIVNLIAPQNWVLESTGTKKTESAIDFKGGYDDPTTGEKVTVGTQVDWGFDKAESLSSNARVTGRSLVNGFAENIRRQYEWLFQHAKDVGYTDHKGITQGFGVVTQVWSCIGATNIGSKTESSTFSLTGSVQGVAAMTGGGSVDASLSGSYHSVSKTGSFDSHLYPVHADEAAQGSVALSYEFASFDGGVLIPRWPGVLTDLNFVFNNGNGGTYIAECTVKYKVPDGKGGHTEEEKYVEAAGGATRTISGVPLTAVDVRVRVKLKAGDGFDFNFPNPVNEFVDGEVEFKISGVWPWGGSVTWST